jgi:hypothetical protein
MRAAMAVSSFRRGAIVVEQVREQEGSIESQSSLKVGAEAHARPELAGDRTLLRSLTKTTGAFMAAWTFGIHHEGLESD